MTEGERCLRGKIKELFRTIECATGNLSDRQFGLLSRELMRCVTDGKQNVNYKKFNEYTYPVAKLIIESIENI